MRLAHFTSVLMVSIWVCLANAQPPAPKADHALKSFAESLRSRGIETSKESLLTALLNNDPEIRALAAGQLAQDHESDAIPSLEDALSNERDPQTRIAVSSALYALGDKRGIAELQTMCSDKSLPVAVTIAAVQTLEMTDQSTAKCGTVVLASLYQIESEDYRAELLSLLPGIFRDSSSDQAKRIVSVTESFLSDQEQQPAVRINASHVLIRINAPSAIHSLRGALAREQDPDVRASLQQDLNAVSRRP